MKDEIAALFKPSIVAALAERAKLAPVSGSQDEITERLNELAHTFLLNRFWQTKPPPSDVAKRLRAIRSAAEELGRKLPQSGPLDAEARFRITAQAAVKVSTPELTDLASGHERLQVVTAMLGELIEWSRAAEKREAYRKGRRTGNRGDVATQALINGLAEIWFEHWGRPPGISRDDLTGEVRGPFVRFVQCFRDALHGSLSPADYAQDPGLRQALKLTPQAIRERARKTPMAKLDALAERMVK